MFFKYLAAQRSQIGCFVLLIAPQAKILLFHRFVINSTKYIFTSVLVYNSLLCVYVFWHIWPRSEAK